MGKLLLRILFYTSSILMLLIFTPCFLTMQTASFQKDMEKHVSTGNIRSLFDQNSVYRSVRILRQYIAAAHGNEKRIQQIPENSQKINHVILYNTGRAYLGLHQYDKALEYFHQAVVKNKNYKYPYANMGVILIRQGRYKDAEKQLRKALALDTKYVYALTLLGEACLKQGDYEHSLVYVNQALELETKNSDALMTRAWTYLFKGATQTAIRDAEKMIELNHDTHAGLHILARCYLDMGQPKRALEVFRSLGDSSDPQVMTDLGLTYCYLGEFDNAKEMTDEIRKTDRDWGNSAVGLHYQERFRQLQSNIAEQLTILETSNMLASGRSGKNRAERVNPEKGHLNDFKPPEIIIFSHDMFRGRGIAGRITAGDPNRYTIKGRAIDENGISEIRINNKSVQFEPNGAFNEEVHPETGRNAIIITATDRFRNTAVKEIALFRQEQAWTWRNAILAECSGNYYALIIGNDHYRYIKPLQTAAQDAYDINSILRQKYAFNTKLLINATRSEIMNAINYFRKTVKEEDKFLLYYAGHSVFDKLADKAYWLPVNALADSDTHWIIIDAIMSNIRRFAARHILIVTDSCYSGTFTRRTVIDMHPGLKHNRYLLKMLSKTSRTLMASGGNEPVSDLSSQGNSVFASAFITGLVNMNRELFTAEELFYEYVRESVAGNSAQTPQYNVIRNSGHGGGDFPFLRVYQ